MAGATIEIAVVVKRAEAAALALFNFARSAVKAASDAEQAVGGVSSVFKGNSAQINAWAGDAARNLGLTTTEYQTFATKLGASLKGSGVPMSELAAKTNDLVSRGADLAATFGGSTTEAVNALGAALRGEYDPIERYGVAMKASDVSARLAAQGQSHLTGQAKKTAEMAARLAILYEQTGDAAGQFARESETAAGKQAILTAEFGNAKARIGGALLPAFVSLMDVANDLMPTLEGLATIVGTAVGAFAKLPAPLQLAALAGAAMIKLNWKEVSSAWERGATSGQKFAGAAGAVAGSFAGGAVIGGAVALLTSWVKAAQSASKAAAAFAAQNRDMASQVVDSTGKIISVQSVEFANVARQTETYRKLTDAKVSEADAIAVLTGRADDSTKARIKDTIAANQSVGWFVKVTSALGAQEESYSKAGLANRLLTEAMEVGNGAIQQQAEEVQKANAALQAEADAAGGAAAKQQELAAAAEKAAEAEAEQAAAAREAAQSILEQAAASTRGATMLAGLAREADNASRAASILGARLDELSGRNRTAEQTVADLNDAMRNAAAGFAEAKTAGDLNKAALLTWNVAALTANKTGSDVYARLNDVRGAYDRNTAAAYAAGMATGGVTKANEAARAAASTAYSQFLTMARGLGITGDEATTLARKIGILNGTELSDKELEILLEDHQARAELASFEAKRVADKHAAVVAEAKNVGATDAAIDAVARPRTATITVTQFTKQIQQQFGTDWNPAGRAAPTLAAYTVDSMAGAAALGRAPSAPRYAPTGAGIGGGSPVIINVSGALDTDGVARQISGLLTGRDRRAHTTVLASPRTGMRRG